MDEKDRIQIKNERVYDPQMKVYLLCSPDDPKETAAFKALGSGEVFTLGFSSVEKVKAFVKKYGREGRLGSLAKTFGVRWVTMEEYFNNTKNNELVIDIPETFPIDFGIPDWN